jgi:hypothetical protein
MKLQIPSAKLQRNFNHQAPSLVLAAVLVFEIWSFSGAWMLVLGAF